MPAGAPRRAPPARSRSASDRAARAACGERPTRTSGGGRPWSRGAGSVADPGRARISESESHPRGPRPASPSVGWGRSASSSALLTVARRRRASLPSRDSDAACRSSAPNRAGDRGSDSAWRPGDPRPRRDPSKAGPSRSARGATSGRPARAGLSFCAVKNLKRPATPPAPAPPYDLPAPPGGSALSRYATPHHTTPHFPPALPPLLCAAPRSQRTPVPVGSPPDAA